MKSITLACLLAACGKFQDPNVVVDLRILALNAEPADQLVDVDLTQPVKPVELLAQLVPTKVCALVADPALDRRLTWRMRLCEFGDGERCYEDTASVLGSGTIDDPDTTQPEPQLCATVNPDSNLLAVLLGALGGDQLQGLGGVDVEVELRIGGELDNRGDDEYAAKDLRVSPRIPKARSGNHNPTLDHVDASIDDGPPIALPLGRCAEQTAPFELGPATKVRLTPVEDATSREDYVAPTLDGLSEMFTETLTYQWVASGGSVSKGQSGGPRDITGNPAPLFTDFKSPSAEDISGPTDIALWIIQRDERLGVTWYESCIRVTP